MPTPTVRKLEKYVPLSKDDFRGRFMQRFYDPAFDEVRDELERVCEKAWDGYIKYRKSPRTRAAGEGFADPSYKLPLEWLETRDRIREADARFRDPKSPSRILLVNGSTRSEHSCPGEISKTRRLVYAARELISNRDGFEVDFLDVSIGRSGVGMVRPVYAPHEVGVYAAAAVKGAVSRTPVFAVQRILTPDEADAIVARGDADAVTIVRALIADEAWAAKARTGRADAIRRCTGINQGCYGNLTLGLPVSCVQNPSVGREHELGALEPAARCRRGMSRRVAGC